jgi:hypothetical protein
MPQTMSADAAYCHERASDCAAKAQEARDKRIKADLLDLKARWLLLAQSCQFAERATSDARTIAVRKWRAHPPADNDLSSVPNDSSVVARAFDGPVAIAFDGALRAAGLRRDEAASLIIARRIIELSNGGEHDPLRLQEGALETHFSQMRNS